MGEGDNLLVVLLVTEALVFINQIVALGKLPAVLNNGAQVGEGIFPYGSRGATNLNLFNFKGRAGGGEFFVE